MPDFKEVVETVLLPLQLSLGIFLIMKTTPLWAVIHCTIAYLLNCIYFPYTDYKQLEGFNGRVFKRAISHATTAGEVLKLKTPKESNNPDEITVKSEKSETVSVDYLGQKFVLERKEGYKMLVKSGKDRKDGVKTSMKDGPTYYITEKMWETVQYIAKVPSKTVLFVKNHKEIWEEVVTGDIMEFEEVLDAVILDNHAVIRLDHDYFLPVNLLLAEDKLQKTLNFVGLFLKTQKHIHWLIPALLTFTAVVMGFSTTLRLSIVGVLNTVLCTTVRIVCDLLPLPMRRRVYYWGSWVEGLKPSNDFQSRIVKGNISVLVAGGAKFYRQSSAGRIIFADCLVDEICSGGGPCLFKCDSNSYSSSDSVYIEWIFDDAEKCLLKAGRVASEEARSSLKADNTYIVCGDGDRRTKIDIFTSNGCKAPNSLMADDIHTASVDIDCSREEAKKLFIFASYMAELKSGSLKSYNRNTVCVRRFVESINAYVRSGYPTVYKLDLHGVVVR